MKKPPSQRWLDAGDLRRHRASRREIADLLAVADRDLVDARVAALSLDRRFATAYAGALQVATIVLAASGFRAAAKRGHHVVMWQALPEFMGAGTGATAVYFDLCRALRNRSDYDRTGVVSAAEVDEVLREAEALREKAGRRVARPGASSGRPGTDVEVGPLRLGSALRGGPHARVHHPHRDRLPGTCIVTLVRQADGPHGVRMLPARLVKS